MLNIKKNGLEFGRNYNLPSASSTSTRQSTQHFQSHHHRGFPRKNLDGLPDNSCFMITFIIGLCSLHFFKERMIYSSTHFHGPWDDLHIASITPFPQFNYSVQDYQSSLKAFYSLKSFTTNYGSQNINSYTLNGSEQL